MEKSNKEMYSIHCSDSGMQCDFHVCDSSEDEVLAATQDHARRAHGKEVSTEDLRSMVKTGAMACG
jgi:predicted small metal-binding protein